MTPDRLGRHFWKSRSESPEKGANWCEGVRKTPSRWPGHYIPCAMELAVDWIHLEPIPDLTLSMGEAVGAWRPGETALPVPEPGGLVLSLVAASVWAGDPGFAIPGAASVWEVLACEERERVVPGLPVFAHPSPSCGICPACRSDSHALCLDAHRRPSGPGWFSRHRTLHPWNARRGVIQLPPGVDPGAASLLEPLARILRLERRFPRRDRVVVVGSGLPAFLAGIALEGPRRRVLVGADPCGMASERGFHAACSGSETAREALDGPADLVVLVDGSLESVRIALGLLSPGTSVVSLVPCPTPPGFLEAFHAHGASWTALVGTSPDDWAVSARRLPGLSDRLAGLPFARLPLEQSGEAQSLLASNPELLRVELS